CLSLLPAIALAADLECEHQVPATDDAVHFGFNTTYTTDWEGNETTETTAYAVYSCANCGQEQRVEATMVEKGTTPATCTEGECIVYGATCTINGVTYYSNDKECYKVETAPALGHEMTENTEIYLSNWSKETDGSFSLCVYYQCARCGRIIYLYPECEVTTQSDGSKLYTGTVTNICTNETVTFTLVVYTVTVAGGCDATTGAGDYRKGDTVTLAAGSRSGYIFSGWTSDDITVSDPENTEISFEMPEKNVTVTANWTPITYTVTFDTNGGELTGWSSTETEADGTVDYLPRAACEGYTFDGWYTAANGGEKVYTYVTVFTADTTVYAHWTPEAQTRQITEAGFAMKGYSLGANAEEIVVTSNTDGLSLIGGYFEALGQPYSYLIAVVVGEDYAPVTGPLEAGEEYVLMLKADVNAGYDVGSGLTEANVTLNSTIAADDCGENKEESTLGITFVLPVLTDGDTSPAKNTVTVNGSYASATGAGEYEEGDTVTLAAGSRSGYTFSGWTSDDITVPNASSADTSFAMPAKAVTVTANWTSTGDSSGGTIATYAITVERAENGAVTSSHVTAAKDTSVTLTVTPDDGYALDTLTVTDGGGIQVAVTEKNGRYTFVMPASKVTVKAVFTETETEEIKNPDIKNPFEDVFDSDYYYDAVLWAVEQGITRGTSETTFSPDAVCTRAQAVTFLWFAADSPAPKSSVNPFTDVAADAYYYNAVLWAVEQGITLGTGDTTFSPDATCTRAQIMTFLWRAQNSPKTGADNPFADVAADAYYFDAVLWAVKQGITLGTGDTTFSPDGDCARAQIVTFLYRCMK
ncbi:MAG: S-layer homology domain-containing protein, partial [Eubacteriales bacterium]